MKTKSKWPLFVPQEELFLGNRPLIDPKIVHQKSRQAECTTMKQNHKRKLPLFARRTQSDAPFTTAAD